MNKDRKSIRKKKFKIPVTRIGYGTVNITVEANSENQAEKMALAQAGDHEFSEHSSEYIIATNATKQVINVIEKNGDSILSVTTFIIDDTSREKEIVKNAEDLFSQKAAENGVGSGIEDLIEDGYYLNGDYGLFLTWSDNVH